MEEGLGASTHKILDGIFDGRLPAADEHQTEHTGHRRAATNGQRNTLHAHTPV